MIGLFVCGQVVSTDGQPGAQRTRARMGRAGVDGAGPLGHFGQLAQGGAAGRRIRVWEVPWSQGCCR